MSKPNIPKRPNESYTARYRRERGEGSGRAKPGAVQRKLTRVVVAGSLLMFVVVIWLVVELGADRDEMLALFGTSLLFIAAPLLLGLALGGVWVAWRALRQRNVSSTRSERSSKPAS